MTPDHFALQARKELRDALTWIAKDNEAAADELLDAALQSARRIVARPLLGRVRPELAPAPYRFWRVTGYPYLIVYNSDRQPPRVLRFLHMARDLGPLLVGIATAEDPEEI